MSLVRSEKGAAESELTFRWKFDIERFKTKARGNAGNKQEIG